LYFTLSVVEKLSVVREDEQIETRKTKLDRKLVRRRQRIADETEKAHRTRLDLEAFQKRQRQYAAKT
jgi:hypothetical protein